MAMSRETLGWRTPRSICDTALGEMPSDFASVRAEMPRAVRSARMRSPTPLVLSSTAAGCVMPRV